MPAAGAQAGCRRRRHRGRMGHRDRTDVKRGGVHCDIFRLPTPRAPADAQRGQGDPPRVHAAGRHSVGVDGVGPDPDAGGRRCGEQQQRICGQPRAAERVDLRPCCLLVVVVVFVSVFVRAWRAAEGERECASESEPVPYRTVSYRTVQQARKACVVCQRYLFSWGMIPLTRARFGAIVFSPVLLP